MPALSKTSPVLFLSSDDSYFAELQTEGKTPELSNVTKIELPLVKNATVQTEYLGQTLKQLELKSVHLIVSDELFLHYIGDFPVNDKLSLEEHISNTVSKAFPDQEEPLHIVTLDLAKTARIQTIQITAITKTNLQHIADALHMAGATIKSLIPASFVVKAFVSIDPSLFMLETPTAFLLTSHYIGVEYAEKIEHDDVNKLVKTLAKLKDSHPHLQHIYLSLSEQNPTLVKAIEEVFPTQAITIPKIKAESDTPLALKVLTLGYKEVIENKFPFPQFQLPESDAKLNESELPAVVEKVETVEETPTEELELPPKPVMPMKKSVKLEAAVIEKPSVIFEDDEVEEVEKEEPKEETRMKEEERRTENEEETAEEELTAKIDRTISAPVSEEPRKEVSPVIEVVKPPAQPVSAFKSPKKSGNSWFSYVLLTGAVALIISLVGGGIVISQQAIQGRKTVEPIVQEATPSPTPSPTPTAVPEAVKKDSVSILVVNATTKVGYAGKTASVLTKAGYTKTQTANAKGTYKDDGTFIMVSEKAPKGLAAQIIKDTELKLTDLAFDKSEDSAGKYDVIIVLNE